MDKNAEARETEVSTVVKQHVRDSYERPAMPDDIQALDDKYWEDEELTKDEEAKLIAYKEEEDEREKAFMKNKRPDSPLVLVLDVEGSEMTGSVIGLAKVCALLKGVKYCAPELPLSVIVYGETFSSFTQNSTWMTVLMHHLVQETDAVVLSLKDEMPQLLTSSFFSPQKNNLSGDSVGTTISTTLVAFPRLHFFTTENGP